jgi:hypothetical protein
MLSNLVLVAAMIGQTTNDGSKEGPVLSEWAKQAQARALAELRANEPAIKARLAAYHEQDYERLERENQRLMDRIEAVNIATGRVWSVTSGSMRQMVYQYQEPWASHSFASVPPAGNSTTSDLQDKPSLEDLRRTNFLLQGHLRDSRDLNRQAVQLYNVQRADQYQRASQYSRATCTPSRSTYFRRPVEWAANPLPTYYLRVGDSRMGKSEEDRRSEEEQSFKEHDR